MGDTAGNQIMFLDPSNGAVQRRLPIADPYQLQFSPDGKLLVVNGLARNQVDVYDATSMTMLVIPATVSAVSGAGPVPDPNEFSVAIISPLLIVKAKSAASQTRTAMIATRPRPFGSRNSYIRPLPLLCRRLPHVRFAVHRKLLDAAHNIFRAADGPRGPNAARALCEERLHD